MIFGLRKSLYAIALMRKDKEEANIMYATTEVKEYSEEDGPKSADVEESAGDGNWPAAGGTGPAVDSESREWAFK